VYATSASSGYPRTAYLLSLIGGILIVLYALLEAVEAVVYSSKINALVPGASGLLAILATVGLVAGIIVVVGAFQLKSRPESRKGWGVMILLFSLVSFVGGGGLFIGLILGLVGGIMALTWNPPVAVGPLYGAPRYGSPGNPPMGSTPWASPTPSPAAPGGAQRFCSSCGSPNVATAQFCAKCGAPMQ